MSKSIHFVKAIIHQAGDFVKRSETHQEAKRSYPPRCGQLQKIQIKKFCSPLFISFFKEISYPQVEGELSTMMGMDVRREQLWIMWITFSKVGDLRYLRRFRPP